MSVMPSFPFSHESLVHLVRSSVPDDSGGLEGGSGRELDCASKGPTACAVAIGAFDGVHEGHRQLITDCVRDAASNGSRSVVVTFDPDPSEVVSAGEAQKRLLSIEDRVRFVYGLGVDEVLVLPFTHELASLEPQAFVDLLLQKIGPISIAHVGENFHFGARGAGDVATLVDCGKTRGFAVVSHSLLCKADVTGAADQMVPVSSTSIRDLLSRGKVHEAADLLGRCHFVRGSVVHGRGEGTSFGFPTANVSCDGRICLPCEGVYACVVTNGQSAWPAAVNVGVPPSFAERSADVPKAFLEANLIGFNGDLYGCELAVVFVEWLRASRPFSSLDELEHVVLGNIEWVRQNIGDAGVEVGR